jgi:hypothetical protein
MNEILIMSGKKIVHLRMTEWVVEIATLHNTFLKISHPLAHFPPLALSFFTSSSGVTMCYESLRFIYKNEIFKWIINTFFRGCNIII